LFAETLKGKYERTQAVHALTSGRNAGNILAFVLGRQVLVTFTVFALSLLTQYPLMRVFPWSDATIPDGATIFVDQGVVSIIVIACVGQLAPQILAAQYPIQFTELPGSWMLVKLCILIDSIGFTYFSWLEAKLVEVMFRLNRDINSKLHEHGVPPTLAAGMTFDDNSEGKFVVTKTSPARKIWSAFRYFWSTAMVLFSAAFVLPGIVAQQSIFSSTFPGVHGVICLFIFLLLLVFLWILEGSQVSTRKEQYQIIPRISLLHLLGGVGKSCSTYR
jgi:hypothetical protein